MDIYSYKCWLIKKNPMCNSMIKKNLLIKVQNVLMNDFFILIVNSANNYIGHDFMLASVR